jgi:methyl-accepting chemotaxis protein
LSRIADSPPVLLQRSSILPNNSCKQALPLRQEDFMGALSFLGFGKQQPAFPLVTENDLTPLTDLASEPVRDEKYEAALDSATLYQQEAEQLRSEVTRQEADLQRLMQMLDNVTNVVMLCDATHENRVFYMNKVAREIFEKYRTDLNHGLRGADVGNAHGHSIHQYHKNPERVRQILSKPKRMPHHADIPIGGTVFRTSTYPIWDSQDSEKLLCYMACWTDVTAENKLAEEQVKVRERQLFLESHVREIAAALHEMSAAVAAVAQNTQEASTSTNAVNDAAVDGQRIVSQAVAAMQQITAFVHSSSGIVAQLGEKSNHIGQIVEVIDEIADQTNLLALNAAIEAARAGDQGRGFAVVATEVRKLAERTRGATQDIAQMVSEIQSSTGLAIKTMEHGNLQVRAGEDSSRSAEKALAKIVNEIDLVREMITQIAAATEQQSAATQEITRTVEQLTQA